MKHLKVAEARAKFGEVLDEAERGVPVFIERRGVRFRVTAEAAERPARAAAPDPFSYVDPAVMSGNWTWKLGPKGLVFVSRRKRKRR